MASDSAYAITASAMRDYSYETTNDEIKKKHVLGFPCRFLRIILSMIMS